jgi:hypothetical protein
VVRVTGGIGATSIFVICAVTSQSQRRSAPAPD